MPQDIPTDFAVTASVQETDHPTHHREHFITKYVFSQDHKMISKQFLITGIFWALMGGLMSVLFRLQLGFPQHHYAWLQDILGHWAPGGHLSSDAYYALVTMHGTVLIFFCADRGT